MLTVLLGVEAVDCFTVVLMLHHTADDHQENDLDARHSQIVRKPIDVLIDISSVCHVT